MTIHTFFHRGCNPARTRLDKEGPTSCSPETLLLTMVQISSKDAIDVKGAPDDLRRKLIAEFVGSTTLVATIIGSGIMAENLSAGNDGVALLGNTLATWGILFVLITVFGPISGAHFNPIVSMAFCLKRELGVLHTFAFILAQIVGAISGAFVAHANFDQPLASFDGKDRSTVGEFVGEITATIGLLMTIFGSIAAGEYAKNTIPMAVGLYITAGCACIAEVEPRNGAADVPALARKSHLALLKVLIGSSKAHRLLSFRTAPVSSYTDWFTASTAFANPAVTIGRSFTHTFASIAPSSIGPYVAGQVIGLFVGLPFCEFMFARKSLGAALLTLCRR